MELKLEDLYQELGITEFLGPSGDWGRASRAIPALPAVTPKPPEAPKRSKGEILNDYDMQQCEQEDEGEVALKKPTSARRKRAPRPNATTVTILELENRLKALLEEHTRAGQENQRLRNRLGVIEALLPVRVQPGDDLARLHSQSSDVALGTSYDRPSQHHIEAATEQWVVAWRVWVRDAALLSVAYTTRPSELYLRKIDAAFERVCEEGARIWYPLGLPDVICGAYQLNVDTGRPETPPDSHWKEVAEGMGVTQQQVSACRAALALYRERMEVVMAERSRLTERLADSMAAAEQAAEAPCASPCELPGSAHFQRVGVEAAAAAEALNANVAAEGRATRLAREFLRSNILTSLQRARCTRHPSSNGLPEFTKIEGFDAPKV
eukprot:XP_001703413.1 predicted protein [Chlamydomonas reinhardtii]